MHVFNYQRDQNPFSVRPILVSNRRLHKVMCMNLPAISVDGSEPPLNMIYFPCYYYFDIKHILLLLCSIRTFRRTATMFVMLKGSWRLLENQTVEVTTRSGPGDIFCWTKVSR
jgi:hypothetical protein